MRTNVQEIQNVDEQQIMLTTYSSVEMRFSSPIPDYGSIHDLCFIVFRRSGRSLVKLPFLSLAETRYGFGIGFGCPREQHYSSFLFQFPAGLYLGYRIR